MRFMISWSMMGRTVSDSRLRRYQVSRAGANLVFIYWDFYICTWFRRVLPFCLSLVVYSHHRFAYPRLLWRLGKESKDMALAGYPFL